MDNEQPIRLQRPQLSALPQAMTGEEPTVTFITKAQLETVSDWLHNEWERLNVSEYGEPMRCILIVDTEETTRVLQKGSATDTDTLKLMDFARRLVKHGCRMDTE